MSKRSSSHKHVNRNSSSCNSGMGSRYNKERFNSEAQARRRAKSNRKWKKGDRLPVPYFCEDCHGFHLTSPADY